MRDLIMLAVTGFVLIIFGIILQGCTTVKPYEREHLADRVMQFDAFAEEVMLERHFLETREGSIGGNGGAGGGCACN